MTESPHHAVPSTELYWAVIDTSGFPPIPFQALRPGAAYQRLANQFDAVLPLPVEKLHVIYRPLDGHSVLACGIEPKKIAALREQGLESVFPESIPSCIKSRSSGGPDPRSLNLLTGPYTPKSTTARRSRQSRFAAAAILLLATLVTVGNIRRISASQQTASALQNQQQGLYDSVLGPGNSRVPPAIGLTTELRRLSMTRGTDTAAPLQSNAPLDLQTIFQHWPPNAALRIERIAVETDRIDIAGEAGDIKTIEHLIETLSKAPGWSLETRRIDQAQGGTITRARLGFERTKHDEGRS